MAGKKGMKGGGGARPGAGRPKKAIPKLDVKPVTDPKVFLLAAMNDTGADARLRITAATALLPYLHVKAGEGKKVDAQVRAERASKGLYAPGPAPKLKLINPTKA